MDATDVSPAVSVRLSMTVRTKVAKIFRLIVEVVAVFVIEFERQWFAAPEKPLSVELTFGIITAVGYALLASVFGIVASHRGAVARLVAIAQDFVQ